LRQGASSRSFFSIRKELIPSSASLRVLAERFAQEFAAGQALLVRQTIDLDGEIWRERDGDCPRRAHEPTITRSLTQWDRRPDRAHGEIWRFSDVGSSTPPQPRTFTNPLVSKNPDGPGLATYRVSLGPRSADHGCDRAYAEARSHNAVNKYQTAPPMEY
jgi:hypothetical protein